MTPPAPTDGDATRTLPPTSLPPPAPAFVLPQVPGYDVLEEIEGITSPLLASPRTSGAQYLPEQGYFIRCCPSGRLPATLGKGILTAGRSAGQEGHAADGIPRPVGNE